MCRGGRRDESGGGRDNRVVVAVVVVGVVVVVLEEAVRARKASGAMTAVMAAMAPTRRAMLVHPSRWGCRGVRA